MGVFPQIASSSYCPNRHCRKRGRSELEASPRPKKRVKYTHDPAESLPRIRRRIFTPPSTYPSSKNSITTPAPKPAAPIAQPQTAASAEPFDILQIDHYEGFLGAILSLFVQTIRVEDEEHHKTYYLKVKGLVKHLCRDNTEVLGDYLSNSEDLNRLALETFNPVIGRRVYTKDVAALFHDFRSSEFMQSIKQTYDPLLAEKLASAQFEKLKERHLEVLPYDRSILMQKLKPGDIFFKKLPHDAEHPVIFGQKLFQPLIIGEKERESYKYSHVAIYLGNGKVAEAVPDKHGSDVRIIDLADPHFALEFPKQYLVARCSDEALAATAVAVAAKVADEVGENQGETSFKYTKFQALRSIWHPYFFGPLSRYRYMKQYIDDHKNQVPVDFIQPKSFFCSYFVGYSYQTAESRSIMPDMLGETDAPLKMLTPIGNAISRGIWARLRRIQFWKGMSERIRLQFDAKRLTPQDFRNFMIGEERGRNLFKDIYLIKA